MTQLSSAGEEIDNQTSTAVQVAVTSAQAAAANRLYTCSLNALEARYGEVLSAANATCASATPISSASIWKRPDRLRPPVRRERPMPQQRPFVVDTRHALLHSMPGDWQRE